MPKASATAPAPATDRVQTFAGPARRFGTQPPAEQAPKVGFLSQALNLFRKERRAVESHIDELALAIARHEIDPTVDPPLAETVARTLDASRMSETQFVDLVGRYKRAIVARSRCKDLGQLRAAADQAERAWKQADLEEGQRARAAHARLEAMQMDLSRAIAAVDVAMQAESEFQRCVPTTERERQLAIEARELASERQTLEIALKVGAIESDGQTPTVANRLAHEKRVLADLLANRNQAHLTPERTARQQRIVERMEAEVQAIRDRIAKIDSRTAGINAEIDRTRAEFLQVIES